MNEDESGVSQMTTDRETIREWADQHDVSPVRTTDMDATTEESQATASGSHPFALRTETTRSETEESLSWEEFFEGIEDHNLVVMLRDEPGGRPLEVVTRDQAVRYSPYEATEFEEHLVSGETITTEVTDTTVIERTIVEHATIESEVVDTEVLDSQVIGVELRSREIGGCEVTDREAFDEVDHARFDDMSQLTSGYHEELPREIGVEVDVKENWSVTRELLERATIESRIVDVDVTETDEVESESHEGTIEIEGIQQALLESDVIEIEADTDEIIQSETIESEFQEDDVVRTQINQLRVVENDITERKVVRGHLNESEVIQIEETGTVPIQTAFVEGETLDEEPTRIGLTEHDARPMADDDAATAEMGNKPGPAGIDGKPETAGMPDEAGTAETSDEPGTDDDIRTVITEEDEGKPVVGAEGQELGMVEEVRGNTAYINPEPGLVDRIRSKLGWGDADEEDYTIDEQSIDQITEDEVRLGVR